MALFMRTDKDPEGTAVRVEAGLKHKDGTCFLVLHRLPPEYAKPPTFVVRLSGERMEVRGSGQSQAYFKAFAYQKFSAKELKLLVGAREGEDHLPFFNFSYPTVIRVLGKSYYKMRTEELRPLVEERTWKLVATTE
ncbi:MAG: hypothetical protein U1E26_01285 [Coriobacteriia bacterium]|nr:hypothetical protein [Coriobacteriia bacterium]